MAPIPPRTLWSSPGFVVAESWYSCCKRATVFPLALYVVKAVRAAWRLAMLFRATWFSWQDEEEEDPEDDEDGEL
jgi:hypothetical protein